MAVTQIRLYTQAKAGSLSADSAGRAIMEDNYIITSKILDASITVAKLGDFYATNGGSLTLNYAAGRVRNNTTITDVSSGSLSLTDNATNYIEVDSTASVSFNTTGFTDGRIPIAVAVTSGGAITSIADKRAWVVFGADDDTGFLLATNHIIREVPTGAINGSNVTFTLAFTPISGKEEVYLNGILQNAGGSNDYTISSATITFNNAPNTGDVLLVSYIK